MNKEDYWGNLTLTKKENSPRRVLEQQAEILEQKTKNLLTGSVASQTINKRIRTTLAVIAPALDYYQLDLVSVYYSVDAKEFYPLLVRNELTKKGTRCKNEGEFKAKLKEMLSSRRTTITLQRLLDVVAKA